MKNNTTISMETIKAGSCQWNAETAKGFRATIAKWHNADFDIADNCNIADSQIKNKSDMLKSNAVLLDKLEKGQSIIGNKSKADIEAENDKFMAEIEVLRKDKAEYRKAQADRLAEATALLTDELIEAFHDADRDAKILATAQWLSDNGVEPRLATCEALVNAIGKKPLSNKQKALQAKHNGTLAKGTFMKTFLGELCDLMGNQLPLYTFTFMPTSKRGKKSDK